MLWIGSIFRNYALFDGRANRREYWLFILNNAIALLALVGFHTILSICTGSDMEYDGVAPFIFYSSSPVHPLFVLCIYLSIVLIPTLGITTRRLHDTNRGVGYLLFLLLPVIGWTILLTLLCLKSDAGVNQYGAQPVRRIAPTERNTPLRKALIAISILSLLCIFIFFGQERVPRDLLPSYMDVFYSLPILGYTFMGIAFLQRRDYSRFVGISMLIFTVLFILINIVRNFYSLDFETIIEYFISVHMILLSIQLIRKKRYSPFTDSVLIVASLLKLTSLVYSLLFLFHFYLDMLSIQWYATILSSFALYNAILLYAIANRIEQSRRNRATRCKVESETVSKEPFPQQTNS